MKKTGAITSIPNSIPVISAWCFLFLWVFLTPQRPGNYGQSRLSDALRLKANRQQMEKYIARFQKTPRTLRHLQVFAGKQRVFLVDQAGHRLQYMPLDESSWLIRSFGFDGVLNTLLSDNDSYVASWSSDQNAQGLSFSYKKPPHLYPAPLLMGTFSPDRTLKARLFQHHSLGSSSLVVHQNGGSSFVNVAFHDKIEEFYWLPNSKMLVFSAGESERYGGGLYLWNLLNNETKKVFPAKGVFPGQGASSDSIQLSELSLAGFDKALNRLSIFLKAPLSTPPDKCYEFFAPSRLMVFDFEKATLHFNKQASLEARKSTRKKLHPLDTLALDPKDCEIASPLQKTWCDLPVDGPFEDVIQSWQAFTEAADKTPVFTHGLFVLSALYLDVLHLWAGAARKRPGKFYANDKELKHPDQVKEVLAAYGAELVNILRMQTMAPTWMLARSHDFWNLLLLGKSPKTLFSNISLTNERRLRVDSLGEPTEKK